MRGKCGVWRSGASGQRAHSVGIASTRTKCRQRGEAGGTKQAQGYAGRLNQAAPGDPSPNAIPMKKAAAGAAVRSPILNILGCRQCPRPFVSPGSDPAVRPQSPGKQRASDPAVRPQSPGMQRASDPARKRRSRRAKERVSQSDAFGAGAAQARPHEVAFQSCATSRSGVHTHSPES